MDYFAKLHCTYEFVNSHLMELVVQTVSFSGKIGNFFLKTRVLRSKGKRHSYQYGITLFVISHLLNSTLCCNCSRYLQSRAMLSNREDNISFIFGSSLTLDCSAACFRRDTDSRWENTISESVRFAQDKSKHFFLTFNSHKWPRQNSCL